MVTSIPTSTSVQEQLVSDIKSVISEGEEILSATADQAGEKIGNLRERIKMRLADSKVRLIHAEEVLLAKTKATAQATDEFVHESPWTSIGIAAGVGVLIGMLISRR